MDFLLWQRHGPMTSNHGGCKCASGQAYRGPHSVGERNLLGDLDDLYSNLHLPGATTLRRHRDRKITLLLTAVEDINKWRISRGDGGTTDFPGPGQFAIIRVQIFRQDRDPLDPQAFGRLLFSSRTLSRNLACTAGIETSSCWLLEPRPRWLHQLLTFAVSISISKATKSRFRPRAIASRTSGQDFTARSIWPGEKETPLLNVPRSSIRPKTRRLPSLSISPISPVRMPIAIICCSPPETYPA